MSELSKCYSSLRSLWTQNVYGHLNTSKSFLSQIYVDAEPEILISMDNHQYLTTKSTIDGQQLIYGTNREDTNILNHLWMHKLSYQ